MNSYYESEECGRCIYQTKKTDVHEGMGVYDQYRYNIGRISTYSLYGENPQVAEAFAGACRRYKEKD